MRLIKTQVIKNYLHLMPDTFSFSTTSTIAFLKDKKNVKFIPIEINKRQKDSKSTIKPKHAFTTLMLIFRLIMLFSPLRIFLPVSFFIFLLSLVSGIYNIFFQSFNITDITILLFTSSLLIFFFGLLADQIAGLRRETKIIFND